MTTKRKRGRPKGTGSVVSGSQKPATMELYAPASVKRRLYAHAKRQGQSFNAWASAVLLRAMEAEA